MIDIRGIDELVQRLANLVPAEAGAAQADIASTFKATLQSGLSRLNLVTREEFDVQRLVLLRTREKVEVLEQQIDTMERALERLQRGH